MRSSTMRVSEILLHGYGKSGLIFMSERGEVRTRGRWNAERYPSCVADVVRPRFRCEKAAPHLLRFLKSKSLYLSNSGCREIHAFPT